MQKLPNGAKAPSNNKHLVASVFTYMRVIFLFLLMDIFFAGNAQNLTEKSIEVGQFLYINPCNKNQKEFISMDVYARTKPYNKKLIDTTTGDGLLDEFFKDKSIDAKRLPCSMGGHKYRIAALHQFNEAGQNKRVILLYTAYPLTLIWVELDKALELGEIKID